MAASPPSRLDTLRAQFEADLAKHGSSASCNVPGLDGWRIELIRGDVTGAWCGYAVPPPHFELEVNADGLDVHGGVTWQGDGKIGFDCAHWNDFAPGLISVGWSKCDTSDVKYWPFEDAKEEAIRFAHILTHTEKK